MRGYRPPGQDDRLAEFGRRLSAAMLTKGWSGADLAREASKHVPKTHLVKGKRFELGRHLISAYQRGANEPTLPNLGYIAAALGVKPESLLPPSVEGAGTEGRTYAQATTTLDGKTRLVVDTETDPETALKVMTLLRSHTKSAA